MNSPKVILSSATEPAPPVIELTAASVALLDNLAAPTWTWDIDANSLHWASKSALSLWAAPDLASLREHAARLSSAMLSRLSDWRLRLSQGPFFARWEFGPQHQPRSVQCRVSPATVGDGRRFALVECKAIDFDAARAETTWNDAQYKAVDEDQIDLVCRFRPDGTMTYMNHAFQRYFGRFARDMIGKSFMPLMSESDRAAVCARIDALNQERPINVTKGRIVAPDGRVRWHSWTDQAAFDEQGKLLEVQAVGRDITANELGNRLIEGQNRILELIANGAGLTPTLNQLCLVVEQIAEPAICSVLLREGPLLRHGAAPNLPTSYCDAIDGVEFGPTVGSCGTAVYYRRPVAVADIANDPLWKDFRELAAEHKLAACWSYPILDDTGEAIATFALYFNEPRKPLQGDWRLLEAISRLVRIAIERETKDRALHEATQRLKILAANIPGVVFQRLVTPDGAVRYTYVSDGSRDIFGLSPDEIVNDVNMLLSRFDEDDREKVVQQMRTASQSMTLWEMEIPITARDGTRKWTHSVARPRRLPDGGVLWEGIILDVSRIKAAEIAAEAAQSQLVDAIESSSEGFALFDANDRLAVFNQRYIELYPQLADVIKAGVSFETLERAAIERGMIIDFDGTADEWVKLRLAKRRAPGAPMEFSLPGQRFTLVSERRTVVGGLVSVHTDVTGLKRQQAEMRQQSILLQSTLDNMDQGLSVFDHDLRLVALNPRFCEILGFPAEYGHVGRPFADFLRYNAVRGEYGPGDIEQQVSERVEQARHFEPHVFERIRPDGTVIEVRGNPMPGGGFVTSYTDITERQNAREALRASEERLKERVSELEDSRARLERQGRELAMLAENLARARDEAEAASRTKSEFLANMSHELRTPLNAIIGFSEVMMKELFGPLGDAHYRDYARDVHDSGTHLLDLINDILDLSKVEAGRLDLHEDLVDIGSVLSACDRLMRERAHNAGVVMKLDLQPDLPPIRADEIKLKQILLNLLSNAVKFTPRGGSVSVIAGRNPHGDFLMQVRDSGIGMKLEEIPIALQPFRQIDSALSRKHAGTGLGLPLTKGLVELHGGTISIESEPGIGTTVSIGLPASRFAVQSDTRAPAAPRPGNGKHAPPGGDRIERSLSGPPPGAIDSPRPKLTH